jgi:hypothetical protein
MSSSNQFTALGPAIVGFQTNGAQIQKGAEAAGTQMGVHAIGPIGVRGEGNDGGPGGSFSAQPGSGSFSSGAQVHIDPQAMVNPGATVAVTPSQYAKPEMSLPSYGVVGDLWLAHDLAVPHSASLWICVQASAGQIPDPTIRPAIWRQVLLGSPVPGPQPKASL